MDMPRQPQEFAPEALLKRDQSLRDCTASTGLGPNDVETRTVCITADGVLLRFLVDGKTISEARSVTYRPQPPDIFQVPPNYAPLLAPEGGPVP